MGSRAKATIQSTLLLVGSLVFALVLCEGMVRLYAYMTFDQTMTDVSSTSVDSALLKKYFTLTGAS